MRNWVIHILLGAACACWAAGAWSAEADGKNDRPATHTNSSGDYFAAGGNVELGADVSGDALLAGGNVVLQRQVKGDATVAGGNVTVRGKVRGNLRAAGGTVTIEGTVSGDARAAGGRLTLTEDGAVDGHARLYGGTVEVRGKIGRSLTAAAEVVRITGEVQGDVDLSARNIELAPSAKIIGRLTYRSPNEAKVDSGAQIAGGVARAPGTLQDSIDEAKKAALVTGAVVGAGILLLLGALLLLLFPGFAVASARTILSDPIKSLLLGIAIFLLVPVLIVVLFLTVIGIPLALVLLPLFPVLLALGYLTAANLLADLLLILLGRRHTAGRGLRLLFLIFGVVLLTLAKEFEYEQIRYGYGFIAFALLIGLGAFHVRLFRAYRGGTAQSVQPAPPAPPAPRPTTAERVEPGTASP